MRCPLTVLFSLLHFAADGQSSSPGTGLQDDPADARVRNSENEARAQMKRAIAAMECDVVLRMISDIHLCLSPYILMP